MPPSTMAGMPTPNAKFDTIIFAKYFAKGNIERFSRSAREIRTNLTIKSDTLFEFAELELSTGLRMYSYGTISHRHDTLVFKTIRQRPKKPEIKGYIFADLEPCYVVRRGDKLYSISNSCFAPRVGNTKWLQP